MALIIAPILLVVLAFKELSGIRGLGLVGAGALLCAVLWVYSPYPRYLAFKAWDIIQTQPEHEQGWVGRRPGFWKRSLAFIAHAPIFGHGTGSIHKLFAGAASPGEPPLAWETTNALQQTFAVGFQIGLIGMCALWAMWLAHLMLFCGKSLPEWIGQVVVIQNIVGSLFDSQLFDSTLGWTYVLGVGAAGGTVLRLREEADQGARCAGLRFEMNAATCKYIGKLFRRTGMKKSLQKSAHRSR